MGSLRVHSEVIIVRSLRGHSEVTSPRRNKSHIADLLFFGEDIWVRIFGWQFSPGGARIFPHIGTNESHIADLFFLRQDGSVLAGGMNIFGWPF